MASRHVYSAEFNEFWKLYPRPTGKLAAWRKWSTALRDGVEAQEIIDALQKQVDGGHFSTDAGFVPHPTTWLNQGRWDDEIKPRSAGAGHAAPQRGHFDGLG